MAQRKIYIRIIGAKNLQENICASVSFLTKLKALVCNFIKKESLAHVFSCKFCEISKNIFFTEHLQATAAVVLINHYFNKGYLQGSESVTLIHH